MPLSRAIPLLLALLPACDDRPPSSARPAPKPVASAETKLRDEARLVLEEHCGPCHLGGTDGANEDALAVFDLVEAEWAKNMDARQLRELADRIGQPAPGQDDVQTSDAEQRRVRRYVEAELTSRRVN